MNLTALLGAAFGLLLLLAIVAYVIYSVINMPSKRERRAAIRREIALTRIVRFKRPNGSIGYGTVMNVCKTQGYCIVKEKQTNTHFSLLFSDVYEVLPRDEKKPEKQPEPCSC
jgi:hypothetical protein